MALCVVPRLRRSHRRRQQQVLQLDGLLPRCFAGAAGFLQGVRIDSCPQPSLAREFVMTCFTMYPPLSLLVVAKTSLVLSWQFLVTTYPQICILRGM